MDMSALQDLGAATIFDLVVIAVLVVSGLLAMMRGFVHEVLSLFGWVGAALFALHMYPIARPFAREYISIELAADALTGLVLLVGSYLITSILISFISKQVGESSLDGLDRTLGFLFGLARGALVVCLVYIGVELILPKDNQPDWLRDGQTTALIEEGAFQLKRIAPEEIFSTAEEEVERAQETERVYRSLLEPTPEPEPEEDLQGYKPSARQELERLLNAQ